MLTICNNLFAFQSHFHLIDGISNLKAFLFLFENVFCIFARGIALSILFGNGRCFIIPKVSQNICLNKPSTQNNDNRKHLSWKRS